MVDFIRKTNLYRVARKLYRSGKFKDPDFVYKKNYAIGIFTGASIFNLGPPRNMKNPVLTATDVTDAAAVYVADPFLIKEGAAWYMFFEVLNRKSRKGDLSVAKSDDGFSWKYDRIILSEPFHLSYPYVFEWKNEYYMIPESVEIDEIRLYKADDFPTKWSYVNTLMQGSYCDSSIIYYNQQWWLFAAKGNDDLYLFFAKEPMGPWKEHPKSPILIGDPHIARPGGRVVAFGGKVIRFAQDDFPTYGLKVHALEITKLSTEIYEEKIIVDSLLKPSGHGWNAGGMHHICPWQIGENQWIASVDGWGQQVKAFPKEISAK